MKTNSPFVEILEKRNGKYIKRKKRKGIKPYARTLKFNQIDKILSTTNILYPKVIKNRFNYVLEEYIDSTEDINLVPQDVLTNYFVDLIYKLNNIEVDKYKKIVSWNNNSEFMLFQINNLKQALKVKQINIIDLDEQLNKIIISMDNNRKLCFIHGDLHLNNLIVNDSNIYLIDWEMATIGDLAYELAIHFILMNYSKKDELRFVDELLKKINIDKEKLIQDINEYKKFEMIRRKALHGDVKNHNH